MKKTQTKEEVLSSLDEKLNDSFKYAHQEISVSKNQFEAESVALDFDLIQNKNNQRDVQSKVHSAMMRNSHKLRNMSPVDFSSIPSKFYDEDGKTVSPSDFEPDTNTPNTLPATISKELRSSGTLEVKWTDTRDLPRGQDRDIRALANAVFSSFNIDDKAEVMCVNSFSDNDFLNQPREVNAVAGFLEKYATKPHDGTMIQDFGSAIKNYAPEIKLYHTPSMAYLCVSEPEGQGLEGRYIYAFKRKQDFKLQNKVDGKIEKDSNKRLRNRP
jgi:hypothetical protein